MAQVHWRFTLNNFTDIEINHLKSIFDSPRHHLRFLVFQHEEAPTTGTPHLQGYLQCKKKKTMGQVKTILGTDRVCLLKCDATPQKNYDYCTKNRTAVDGPWEFGVMSGQGKRNDIDDARDAIQENPYITDLELITDHSAVVAKYPRYLSTCKNTFQEAEIEDDEFTPRPGWQAQLSGELCIVADRRKVIWFYDEVGGSGKSTFARGFKINGRGGFIVTGGRHQDIYYAYQREPVVFVDLARVACEKVPYEVIENFKNGGFLSTKYESVWKKFKIPHVVVFANFKPDESKLSADRWDIREI